MRLLSLPLYVVTWVDRLGFGLDGKQSTMVVEGPVAEHQRNLFYVTCWVTAVIFVIVASILAYATIK